MTEGMWPQLVSTALVGTQRRSPETIAVPSPVAMLAPGSVLRSESDLLATAGAITLARRAGVSAAHGIARPAPTGDDARPLAPAAACRRLRLLLGTSVDVDLVALWLALAVERGVGVPGRDLPNLFRLGRAHEQLRDGIVAVAGTRGAWLAALNDDWAWIVHRHAITIDVDDDLAWSEGSLADRVAYLATARRRDPARGRELLEAVWAKEPPAERVALLPTLVAGLHRDDELFLETALDDRRKEVRTAAVGLLATLAGSGYEQRMAERAAATVARSGKKLIVTPPEACDAAMRRDGVEPKPTYGIGERAWWFEQIVSAAPMSAWTALAATPAELIAMKVADDWAPSLHRAWAAAALRTRDAEWATALLSAGFGGGSKAGAADAQLAISLHRLLPPSDAVEAALTRLDAADTPVAAVASIVEICPRPWPRPLAAALLRHLHAQLAATTIAYLPYQLRNIAIAVVNGMPLDAYGDIRTFAASLAGAGPQVTNLAEALVTTADTRYQILQEFA